jgi:hypothetical protein
VAAPTVVATTATIASLLIRIMTPPRKVADIIRAIELFVVLTPSTGDDGKGAEAARANPLCRAGTSIAIVRL